VTVESFIHQCVDYRAVETEHFACSCDWRTAFCGIDITGSAWTDQSQEPRLCVVCVDLYEHFQDVSLCCTKDPDVRHG